MQQPDVPRSASAFTSIRDTPSLDGSNSDHFSSTVVSTPPLQQYTNEHPRLRFADATNFSPFRDAGTSHPHAILLSPSRAAGGKDVSSSPSSVRNSAQRGRWKSGEGEESRSPGREKQDKTLPPLPHLLDSREGSHMSHPSQSSAAQSWILDTQNYPLHLVLDDDRVMDSLTCQPPTRESMILLLEQEKQEFLAWKEEQERRILSKEKERERRRRMADEAQRDKVMRKLMKEQQAWEEKEKKNAGSSSTHSNRKTVGSSSAKSAGAGKRSRPPPPPPLLPPPPGPLPASPPLSSTSRTTRLRSPQVRVSFPGDEPKTPIARQGGKESSLASLAGKSPRSPPDRYRDDQYLSLNLSLAATRPRNHSHTGIPIRHPTQDLPALESLVLSSMLATQPMSVTIEGTRRLAKKLEAAGLEGESWITRQQRQETASDKAAGIPVGHGWRLTEVEGIKVSEGTSSAALISGCYAEALQAHQQQLQSEQATLQRRQRELEELEGLQRSKWAREQVQLQRLDAFARSQREAEERKRRGEAAEQRKEELDKAAELQKQQEEASRLLKEEMNYRAMLEQAKREREERQYRLANSLALEQKLAERRVRAKTSFRKLLQEQIEQTEGPIFLQGIITIQDADGMHRKRRWYELERHQLYLYPETKGTATPSSKHGDNENIKPIGVVDISPGCLLHITDAYEEVQAPHSFSLRYRGKDLGDESTILAFTQSEEEKEKLIVALAIFAEVAIGSPILA